MARLIVATHNRGKTREIKRILKGVSLTVVSLADIKDRTKVKENGRTFFENALKKARTLSKRYPHDFIVAEDSGIEVSYLKGKPGIYSKRYSGKGATDYRNNIKILKELDGLCGKNRRACFRCVGVLMKRDALIKRFEGKLSGFISGTMKGRGGFGYDPVFYLPAYGKTVAQLPLKEKNAISHRAKAFTALKKFLARYLK